MKMLSLYDAIKAVTMLLDDHDDTGKIWSCDVINNLVYAPSVMDAAPVRRGRWVTYPECLAYDGAYSDTHMACSECKHVWDIMDNATETFDYCPHCGAKMDGCET